MDLRAFIDLLSKEKRLTRVTRQVDWRFELGEVSRHHRSPLLFENIKDYPGARLFTNGLSTRSEVALAVGLSATLPHGDVLRELRRRKVTPIKPTVVTSGPVLERSLTENEIDLCRLPVPQWSPLDRGRYLGTWHINVTRDPETSVRNVGVYRMELLGPRQATVSASPTSHLAMHVGIAERQGRPLEMAVAIGVGEVVVMAASAAYPYGEDEYELAGGLQQQSVSLLPCGTINLEVPADSEIVIEGVIKSGVRVQDGPFLDYAGTPGTNPTAFLFEAKRVMSRRDPIFRGASVGTPGAEDHELFAVLASIGLWGFHGSKARVGLQRHLLKSRCFRAFQWAGRVGGIVRG